MSKKYKIIDIGPRDGFYDDKNELIGTIVTEQELGISFCEDDSFGATLSEPVILDSGQHAFIFLQIWVEEIKGGSPDEKE